MPSSDIPSILSRVSPVEIRQSLFHLAKDPLPFRKLNLTLPGHEKSTLHEADDFIAGKLEVWGYNVQREPVQVQAYRRDETKPIMHQYSAPAPEDPWYTAYNLYAEKPGATHPDEIIVVISHKDSQSWCDSPGANDNCIGSVGNMEVARVLAEVQTQRTVRFIWCNEEHSPWTSETAARNAKARGDNIIAVLNLDGIGVKGPADAGRMTSVAGYCEPEGKALAQLLGEVIAEYGIGLEHRVVAREFPNDDDGSFVKAGYPAAVIFIGSWPYGDPNYHQAGDVPDLTDVENAALAVQAAVAAILQLDAA